MIKPIVDLNVDLRERNGLDREARSLYTVILRAQVANQAPIFTSVRLTLRVSISYVLYTLVLDH